MRKIYLLLTLVFVSINAFSAGETWWVVEYNTTTNLLKVADGVDNDGNTKYKNLQLQQKSGNLYYAIKEVTVTAATTIEYKVYEDPGMVGSKHYYGYGSNQSNNNAASGNAWIHLPEGGTYTLVFTFYTDSKDNSLDVIQMAKVSGPSRFFEDDWGTDMTKNSMDFDWSDNNFHLYKNIEITAADVASGSYNLEYKIVTRHRGPLDGNYGDNEWQNQRRIIWYGVGGENTNNASVSFSQPGSYEVDFKFDPILKTIIAAETVRYIDVNIGSTGFATFSCPFPTDVPSSVIAYYVTGYSGTEVTTEKTKKVPATLTTPTVGTGVIVEGDPGIHRFYETTTNTLTGNLLAGTGSGTYEVADNTTYVFAEKDGVVGFYLGVGDNTTQRTYAAYKAYLPLSGGSSREFYGLDFLNNPSGITAVKDLKEEGRYYNLQGQPVAHPTKGIYIHNGKKVIVK